MKKIAESIQKESLSLEQRGAPKHTYFHVVFQDGSEAKEHEYNWSDISTEEIVDFLGKPKTVRTCDHPVDSLTVFSGDLQTTVKAAKGEKVYQAYVAEAVVDSTGFLTTRVIGKKIGIVKDGKVLEERLLDKRTNEIIGFKS